MQTPSVEERIAQLEAAIAAQEALRATLGDAVVEVTIAALRAQIDALLAPSAPAEPSAEQAFTRLEAYIPSDLADKLRAASTVEGERKQVTVLFSDISNYTALSERLDPEDLAALTDDTLKELSAAVYENEGYIDKFMGDAIMAVFGAPISHEDDPERAVRAALAMRERMVTLNRRWVSSLGEAIAIHIGINTGTVIAGNVGSDLRINYTVTGDTVNIAARLRDAAQGGEILVSRDTYRLTRGAFEFAPLAPLHVKGKRSELAAYAVERASLHPHKPRGLQDLGHAFVGRERELRQLRETQRELEAGRGSIVTISGEAGLGKSRLLAEWQGRVGGQAQWAEGSAFEHTHTQAYGPFLDLFRRHIGLRSEDSETQARTRLNAAITALFLKDAEARALLASLLAMRLAPDERTVLAGLSADTVRRRLYALFEELFGRLTRQRPTWLVIEDIDWADLASIELLEQLLPLTGNLPLVIACTFRRETAEAPRRLLDTVTTRHAVRHVHISLAPLSLQSTLAMVEQLLSTPTLPESLRALILDKAEGNPFFVEEVIRTLIERGAIVRAESGDGWVVTPLIDSVMVPDSLQGMIMARLDRLPVETKWVMQQASVIGRIFPFRVLCAIAEDTTRLGAALSEMVREDLIRERTHRPELEYIFTHALMHETAYHSLLAPRRRELHRKAGHVMARLYAERLAEVHSQLAAHFFKGEEWEEAAEYLTRAGDDAARLRAHVEAHVHYSDALRALAHLPVSDENCRRRVETILKLADVGFTLDDPARNLARLAEAEALAQSLPCPPERPNAAALTLARVQFQIGRAHLLRNERREGMAYFRRVLDVATALGDEELLAIPLSAIGQALVWQGQFAQAIPALTQISSAVEKSGNWLEWIWTVGYLGVAQAARGECAAAEASAEAVLSRAQEILDLMALAAAHIVLCLVSLMLGDAERLREEAHGVVILAGQCGARIYTYQGYALSAWAKSRLGQHEAAAAEWAQSQNMARTLGGRLILHDWLAAGEAEIALNAGRVDDALRLAQAAVGAAQAADSLFAAGLAHRVWGQALAASPERPWDEAEAHLEASLAALDAGEARLEAARTHVAWARLLRARGDAAGARDHSALAAAVFEASGLSVELQSARGLA